MRRQRWGGLVGGSLTLGVGAEVSRAHARQVALYLLPVDQDADLSYFSSTSACSPSALKL